MKTSLAIELVTANDVLKEYRYEIDARFDGCRTYVLRGSSSICGVSEDWPARNTTHTIHMTLWQKSIAELARGQSVTSLGSPVM